jgi:hypothetical protein
MSLSSRTSGEPYLSYTIALISIPLPLPLDSGGIF